MFRLMIAKDRGAIEVARKMVRDSGNRRQP